MEEKVQKLKDWIIAKTPSDKSVLIPISGGSDSALAFWLYAMALPGRVLGVYFGSKLRCEEWFKETGAIQTFPTPTVPAISDIARWAALLTRAIQEDRILIGTRNKTEDILGTYSAASRVAAHQPLANVWKADIIALGEYVGVPEEILESSRQADPECGRPEELAKISFSDVDAFAKAKSGYVKDLPKLADDQLAYLEDIYRYGRFKDPLPLKGPEV